jgi:hypothetical protein
VCFKLGARDKDLDATKICAADAMFVLLLGSVLSGKLRI